MIIVSSELVKDPLASIVIATYNQALYIEETVLSALSQNCDFVFEVVIADDGSTDGTRSILKKLQKRYPRQLWLIFNDENLMVTKNYVNAIKNARGKYIATLDGDDIWIEKKKLQVQIEYLEQYPEISLVHTGYQVVDAESKMVINVYNNWKGDIEHKKGIEGIENVLMENYTYYPLGSSSCFRKEVYLEGCCLYNSLVEYEESAGEGTLLNISMCRVGYFGYLPDIMVSYRVNSSSLSHFVNEREDISFRFRSLKTKYFAAVLSQCSNRTLNNILKMGFKNILVRAVRLNAIRIYRNEMKRFYLSEFIAPASIKLIKIYNNIVFIILTVFVMHLLEVLRKIKSKIGLKHTESN